MTATHTANRVAMATRLADFLEQHLEEPTPEQVAALNDIAWARIARLAGEQRIPSQATRDCVVVAIREHRRSTDELWSGLPS